MLQTLRSKGCRAHWDLPAQRCNTLPSIVQTASDSWRPHWWSKCNKILHVTREYKAFFANTIIGKTSWNTINFHLCCCTRQPKQMITKVRTNEPWCSWWDSCTPQAASCYRQEVGGRRFGACSTRPAVGWRGRTRPGHVSEWTRVEEAPRWWRSW